MLLNLRSLVDFVILNSPNVMTHKSNPLSAAIFDILCFYLSGFISIFTTDIFVHIYVTASTHDTLYPVL